MDPFLFLVWMERKVSAKIQLRRGPLYVGPMGLLQTLADAVKLISKELTTPRERNRLLFMLAPLLVFAPVLGSFLVLPFGPNAIIQDFNIGFLLIFALASIGFIGVFTAGWSSNNKYSSLGAMRAVAQNISYEIPLLLSVMGVVLITGSLQMSKIVESQTGLWFIFVQPVAFIIFLTSILGETNRAPFDIPEAESELVAGFHTEFLAGRADDRVRRSHRRRVEVVHLHDERGRLERQATDHRGQIFLPRLVAGRQTTALHVPGG